MRARAKESCIQGEPGPPLKKFLGINIVDIMDSKILLFLMSMVFSGQHFCLHWALQAAYFLSYLREPCITNIRNLLSIIDYRYEIFYLDNSK